MKRPVTYEQMASALDQFLATAHVKRVVPDGTGFTTDELAAKGGLTRSEARASIKSGLAAGDIKVIGKRGRNIVYDVVKKP